MKHLIIDTDTASDDAVALVMALRHPDVRVHAITVVGGNVPVDQGVQNALYTAELCGADVPVHRGLASPILRDLETAQFVHGEDGMSDIGLPLAGRTPASAHAVDALLDAAEARRGAITLVTLGPLSNVAVALLKEPRLAQWVERCVIMGGTGSGPGNVTPVAEYNVWVDPEAAHIVLGSGMPITMVGWDASVDTAFFTPDEAAELRAIGTPIAEFAVDIQKSLTVFIGKTLGRPGFDLPDPLAMAVALAPEIAETQPYAVSVVRGDSLSRGQTIVDRLGVSGAVPNVEVVMSASRQGFVELLRRSLA